MKRRIKSRELTKRIDKIDSSLISRSINMHYYYCIRHPHEKIDLDYITKPEQFEWLADILNKYSDVVLEFLNDSRYELEVATKLWFMHDIWFMEGGDLDRDLQDDEIRQDLFGSACSWIGITWY